MPVRLIIRMVDFDVSIHLNLCFPLILTSLLVTSEVLIPVRSFFMLLKIALGDQLFPTLAAHKFALLVDGHVQLELSFVPISFCTKLTFVQKHLSKMVGEHVVPCALNPIVREAAEFAFVCGNSRIMIEIKASNFKTFSLINVERLCQEVIKNIKR